MDQLQKFHKQHGINLNRFPSVDKRPLDLYKLKKAVETRGGFEKVCKLKKWAEIGRDLGYSGKIMSSLSTSLKNSFQKWLFPYEEYLRVAKPAVQQQLEYEAGGPFTPSSANSPMKRPYQDTPSSTRDDSPAVRASVALNASIQSTVDNPNDSVPARSTPIPADLSPPIVSSGFTAVNSGGFTAVNMTPATFQAVNAPNHQPRRESEKVVHNHVAQTPGLSASVAKESIENQGPTFTPTYVPNGHTPNPLKRTIGRDSPNGTSETESGVGADVDDGEGRRSKRLKKAPPTVVGSHMSTLRPFTLRTAAERGNLKPGEMCEACGKSDDRPSILICDSCDYGYHRNCLDPPVKLPLIHDWHCPRCLVGTGEFGFEEGGIYSLKQFQEKAKLFKDSYFAPKMQFDPVANAKRAVSEDDVEREFWRLVESITEVVEVEYGADIHSTTHGSGFPSMEKHPLDPYSHDLWNLNILPLHPDSLFRYIKSDISGMTVPWLYVGMCFSTFCWHNEDHYSYSANYQHFGDTKTWYCIPGADAERFEEAMKAAVPELFESQPDLLFQLVTLLPPDQLKKAGVNVYALDQRAGQFVITFPQAYHAGFNHGFNFNEAVNFAPADWEPFGAAGVERLQDFRKQPCFSHDELLMTAAGRDTTIKVAKWLGPALERVRKRELEQRSAFIKRHRSWNEHHCKLDSSDSECEASCKLGFEIDDSDVPESEFQCAYCKVSSYLSRFRCHKSGRAMCLLHAGSYECCEGSEEQRHNDSDHTLRYRLSDEGLKAAVQKVVDRANTPEAWEEKLRKVLKDEPRPSLKALRSLVNEGERIPWDLPGLADLKSFVVKCNEWVDEATNYITRKQQNRRKNERVWRKGNSAKAAEQEERERELRKVENIHRLLKAAEDISFDCPEITTLSERSEAIAEFQRDARTALANPGLRSTSETEDLVDLGKGFNVDIPEVDKLDKAVQQMRWNDEARDWRKQFHTLEEVIDIIQRGTTIGMPEHGELIQYLQDQRTQGELWESKAKELMAAETVHYQQLEALSSRANTLPVTRETLSAVDAILTKQREAHKRIVSMYESCKDPDLRKRPRYKDVREVLESLSELNSKPAGTIDLEKELKRHEDWMRKGKKLFGKANAPLHILLAHMTYVMEQNNYCFDLSDKPRMPVEPASRSNTPDETVDARPARETFCMCRRSEAGQMIECELCHEWYHSRCLKIARGKIKEDDRFTCPICDWRVKIPRDAARPKLEDLVEWQSEVPQLPFQPDEEDILEEIISTAHTFRDFMRPYTNPVMTTPDEVTTQRFYLRKIEGAEVLLSYETNFLRQELHKWAPVAPTAPPVLDQSLSTRKPRPTKQQKLMAELGVSDPSDLPAQFRTKQHTFPKPRKSSDANSNKSHHPLQPAPSHRHRSDTPHSSSTGGENTHTHRLSNAVTTTHVDPTYPAYANPGLSKHSRHPESPSFPTGPYYNSSSRNHHPTLLGSPDFTPHSPLSRASGPSIDPVLYSPAKSQFSGQSFSPSHNPHHSMDQVFDAFVADPAEERNEAAEQLDDRRRDEDGEEREEGERFLHEFMASQ